MRKYLLSSYTHLTCCYCVLIMQDVASKIMAFPQQGTNTICILSANGAVSNVTLRQPATYGGTVSYEVI